MSARAREASQTLEDLPGKPRLTAPALRSPSTADPAKLPPPPSFGQKQAPLRPGRFLPELRVLAKGSSKAAARELSTHLPRRCAPALVNPFSFFRVFRIVVYPARMSPDFSSCALQRCDPEGLDVAASRFSPPLRAVFAGAVCSREGRRGTAGQRRKHEINTKRQRKFESGLGNLNTSFKAGHTYGRRVNSVIEIDSPKQEKVVYPKEAVNKNCQVKNAKASAKGSSSLKKRKQNNF